MSLKIVNLYSFTKNVKKLFKRYKQLPKDLKLLNKTLQENPKAGTYLGSNCYKIRIPNSSIPTGKSGGFRVVYYYYDNSKNLYLLTIFSKSDIQNISDEDILYLLKKYNLD